MRSKFSALVCESSGETTFLISGETPEKRDDQRSAWRKETVWYAIDFGENPLRFILTIEIETLKVDSIETLKKKH